MAPFLVFIVAASMVFDFGATQQQFTSEAPPTVNPPACTFPEYGICQEGIEKFNDPSADIASKCRILSQVVSCFEKLRDCQNLQTTVIPMINTLKNMQAGMCQGVVTSTTSATSMTPPSTTSRTSMPPPSTTSRTSMPPPSNSSRTSMPPPSTTSRTSPLSNSSRTSMPPPSTTAITSTTPNTINCTIAKLNHCMALESRAGGVTNRTMACMLLLIARMCYIDMMDCPSNTQVFDIASTKIKGIDNRCEGFSTNKPPSSTMTYKPPTSTMTYKPPSSTMTYKPPSTSMTSPKPYNCTVNKLNSCRFLESNANNITDQSSRCMALNRAKTCFSHLLVCEASYYQLYLEAKNRIASIENRCQGVGGTCTTWKLNVCVGHLSSFQNDTKKLCSEVKEALKCLDNMGACDDNLPVKMQIEIIKQQLNSGLSMMCNHGCTQDDLVQCTLPLQTLGQFSNDLRMMCNVWWNSKTCLYNLTTSCGRNSSIQTSISMILRNVSSSLSFCNSYSSCSNTSMKSCMNGLDYAAPGYPRCEAAIEAQRCIERTQTDCRDPEGVIKAKQFLAMLRVVQREYCGGDGDGDGPSGAGHVNVMLPLLVAMSLVAKIYN